MIHKLRKITNGLYRGSAPHIPDVKWLKDNLGIKKIVSFDKHSGHIIDRVCNLLGIEHIIVPLDETRKSLLDFMKYDLKKLLIDDGPTYLHCFAGKDRSGFVSALFEVKYLGKNPKEAIEEAKSLGFGKDLDPAYKRMIHLYEKIIMNSKSADINNADIVSNEREYRGDNKDTYLDDSHQMSFAPYLSVTKQYPFDYVDNEINEQSPTRQNYKLNEDGKKITHETEIPSVGQYNNSAGQTGAGPVFPSGGFLSD